MFYKIHHYFLKYGCSNLLRVQKSLVDNLKEHDNENFELEWKINDYCILRKKLGRNLSFYRGKIVEISSISSYEKFKVIICCIIFITIQITDNGMKIRFL
jgi:hypothetical protein